MHIGSLVHDVSRLRRRLYDARTRPLGITRAQWWVLYHLSRHEGDPPNQAALALELDLGTPAVGELIGRLETAGFVLRTADRRDRRSLRITIAPRGREVLRHMAEIARINNEQIMRGFSIEEAETLSSFLAWMKANLLATVEDEESGV